MRQVSLIVILVALVITASCGLRPQQAPVPLPATAPTGTGSTPPPSARAEPVTVFLVRDGRLTPVAREGHPGSDGLTTALIALIRAPDQAERTRQLRTALPPDTIAPSWRAASSGEMVVQLPTSIDGLGADDQVYAVAQIVFTVTENSAATGVRFERQEVAIEVPDGAGRLIDRPVTRQDYREIAP